MATVRFLIFVVIETLDVYARLVFLRARLKKLIYFIC